MISPGILLLCMVGVAASAALGAIWVIGAAIRRVGHGLLPIGVAATVVGVWFSATLALVLMGRWSLVQIPLLIIPVRVAMQRNATIGRVIDAIPFGDVAWLSVLRLGGALRLAGLAAGTVPAAFAIPATIGDVIIGASGPLLLATDLVSPKIVRLWSVLGLLSLLVSGITGRFWGGQLAEYEVLRLLFLLPLFALAYLVTLRSAGSTAAA